MISESAQSTNMLTKRIRFSLIICQRCERLEPSRDKLDGRATVKPIVPVRL